MRVRCACSMCQRITEGESLGHFEQLESRALLAGVPDGFVEQTLVTGLSRATALQPLPDGRLLVAEQSGKLRIVKDNQLLATPALSITTDSTSERGLLGVTIDPNFASNGYVYIYWTVKTSTRTNAVSRYKLSGDAVVPGSGKRLLTLDPLVAANHNAGALHFGADNKLYITVGDNAVPEYAQDLTNLHGKVLRINPDGSIPTDNPFYNTLAGNRRAIWAYGLRNPFTFAVHPTTGRMHINDVGLKAFEEINLGRRGANYGWPGTEGPTTATGIDAPISAYAHLPTGQAIAGGAFYAPATSQFPALFANAYFFGDYVAGWIKTFDTSTNTVTDFATGVDRPIDLDVLPDGSLLYLSYRGTIGRISYDPAANLTITSEPTDASASAGESVSFAVEVSGGSNPTHQWYRNDTPIDGATGPTYTHLAAAEDNGAAFFVRITAGEVTVESRHANLTVNTSNTAPVPTITAPAADSFFRAGQTIAFAGSASDLEEGSLAVNTLNWTVEYITGSVVRPFNAFAGVASGSFVVPTTTPYTQPDVAFRITLTATDSTGAKQSTSIDLLPRLSQINLSSVGANVRILLDGSPQASPASIMSVEGLLRTIEAPSTFVSGGVTYAFQFWSDAGPRVRSINVPEDDLSLVATYAPVALGSISGVLYNDNNANSVFDTGDTRISRVVFLDTNNNGRLDTAEPSQTSKSDGSFVFANLSPGEYRVRRVFPSGYTASNPPRDYSLASGQTITGADIGSVTVGTVVTPSDGNPTPPPPATGSISGFLFWDSNRNGRFDTGETYQSSKTAYIDLNANGRLDAAEPSRTTDSLGRFAFDSLAAGTYTVTRVFPTGFGPTTTPQVITLAAGQLFSDVRIGTNTI